MHKPFVVISGLPGSGKTTLARRLQRRKRIDVDTSREPSLVDAVRAIRTALVLG